MQVEGRVRVHARGFGFIEYDTEEGPRSAFIAPPLLNGYLHGDRVRARVLPSGRNRKAAKDLELVRRSRDTLFGEVVLHGGRAWLRPDRLISNTDWPLVDGDEVDAKDLVGKPVLAEIRDGQAVPLRAVPPLEASLERVRARYGIRSEYAPEARDQLAQSNPSDASSRRDLTDLVTITIDAPTSMDLDDALSVLPADASGAIRVFVSIADVDAQVPEDSPLDREARARGTSVYLAGNVTPMFPRELSEDRCSLLPEQTRAALTVELRVDPEGEARSVDIYRSTIRSHRRLSYEEVARVFGSEGECELPPEIVEALAWLRTVASRVGAVRGARGGVRIARTEAYIRVDDDNEPTEIAERADNEAHDLVERLMVSANEAVARWLRDRGVPGVFRVHPPPAPRQVQALVESAQRLGLRPGFGSEISPRALAAFEHQYTKSPSARAMDAIMGKILGPANYQVEPDGHFGLGSPLYLHFTSPIRRYADLAVHRLVKRYLDGHRSFDAMIAKLDELASSLDDLSRRASKAETEWQRVLAARHFAKRVGERFMGRVVAAKTFGLVVHLFGTGVTGTLSTESLPEDASYRGDRFTWEGGQIRVGDKIEVQVANTDEALGRIELTTG